MVITINGMFPGTLINATTNDNIHVNVFNGLDEPLLLTWNGIQQRLNSWQDGVSGTNCPIQPGKNWTYVFQTKDQIGSFFYFPTLNFQKAAGGFGPLRVNNRNIILVPFNKPEAEFDLLIGDWYSYDYKSATLCQFYNPYGPLPIGPNPMDREFSVNQARSISSTERFDPRTISWESVPSMKTSRGGHSVAAFNEKIYAFGGFDGTRNVSEVEVLDPRFGSWIDGDSMHQPRVSAGAIVIGNATEVTGDNAVLSIMPQPMAESQ
ncbi:hypothetical protein IFM89_031556, partial [Coptis chinensis]